MEESVIYDSIQIQQILPHRYPFLLIDKIVEFEDTKRIVAIKNVSINEQFFAGHFPDHPVMPGVLVLEAMAQAGAVLAYKSSDGVIPGKTVYLVGATDVKWKRQVVPGDTLRIEVQPTRKRRPLWIMDCTAKVNDRLVATAVITAAEAD